MLFILNKNYEVVESLNDRGNMAVITPYFDDEYLQDLATGAETFTFSTLADSIQSQHLVVGNFIAFRYKDEYKLFNIINVDEEHTNTFIKTVYCEMASIELINEIIRPMNFSGTVKSFITNILNDTSWQLGALDISLNQTFDLELKDYKSVYSLLQEHMVNTFGAEIAYRVKIKNNKIVGKYIDVYAQRGRNRGLRFAYSKNLTSVKRTIDTSNIATALIGVGNSNITFKDIDAPDKPAGQDFIVSESAYRLWNVNGHHIMGTHKADTDSPQELLKLTRQALEERSIPQTKYEMKVELLGEEVEIGDTVKIVDHGFNPPIYLEGRINQLIVSQTDPTRNECVLANFKEIGTNISAELKELAGYVDSKFPINGSTDIIEGTVGKEQISKTYTTEVIADAVYASLIETEELIAGKASIEDLQATNATIENLKAKDAEIENAVINNAEIFNAQIENLVAKDAQIENLVAEKASIKDLNATNATISNLVAKDAEIENLVVENAQITNANINNLKASVAEVEILVAKKANIEDLNATNAQIENLKAMDAEIQNAIIENADITFAQINQLKADVGEIDTLLAGNITSENIQAGSITSNELATGTITAGSGIIAEGAIGSAEISSIDAGKISAGKIDTSKVEVAGTNNHLRLKGNRIQVFQGIGTSAVERVSIGDVNGDGTTYGLRVRGADGKTILLDENGVTSEGITNGSITNDKISDDAQIEGAKLNINSVVSKLNEDGTEVIKGTKIDVDGTSLTTKLSTITNKQTEHGEKISQNSSSIKANQDAIKLKVDNQTYQTDKTNMTSKLDKNTSDINIMKGEIALKVEQADIENAKSEMEGMVDTKVNSAKAEIKVTTDAISQNVSSLSQTVSNKADGSTVTTLSNKVGSLETSVNGISGKVSSLETTTTTINNKANDAMSVANTAKNTADKNKTSINSINGEITTVKSNMATLDVNLQGIAQRVSNTESTTSSLSTQLNSVSSTATNALNKANSANTLADSKAKVFTTTPTTPYKVGDLWVQGTSGDVMRCKTARSSGSYNSADWEKASKYTDDTKANAVDGKVTNLQTEYNKTKSQVAEIVTDLDGITQRVSNTESTTTTLTTKVNNAQSTANQAKTDASTANTNATNALNKANSANSKIDNLQIGGTNLILGTRDFAIDNSRVKGWYNANGFTITQEGDCKIATHSASGLTSNSIKGLYSSYIPCKKGDIFTISVYIKVENLNNWDEKRPFIVEGYNSSKTRIEYVDVSISQNGSNKPTLVNNEWVRFVYTYTITNVDTVFFGIRLSLFRNGKISFKKAQIEKSNKASDWTPAPEDVDSSIGAVDGKVTTLQGTVNTTNSKVATLETNLNGITQRVSSTESTTATLTTKVNNVESTANTAKTTATNAQSTANTANSNATNALNTANSTNTKLNNLQIGGRNLIRKADVAQNNSTATFNESTKTWTIKASAGAGGAWGCGLVLRNKNVLVPYGKQYVLSFEIKVPRNCSWNTDVNTYALTGSSWAGNDNDNTSKRSTSSKSLTANQWIKCWVKWENTNANNTNKVDLYDNSHFGVVMQNETSDMTYEIRNVQGELGNMPTEYTPAPEDVQSQIDTHTTQISTTNSKVSSIETNLSGITSRVSNVESKTTSIDGKVTSLETWKKSAEQKITDDAIINTVSGTIDSKVNSGINNLQVGTRNLLLNTSLKSDTEHYISKDGSINSELKTLNNNNSFYINKTGLTANNWSGLHQRVEDLIVGETYTFSACVYIPTNHGIDAGCSFEMKTHGADGTTITGYPSKGVDLSKVNQWQTISLTYKIPDKGIAYMDCRFNMTKNGKAYVGDYCLVLGNKATWTPAPEDTDKVLLDTEKKLNSNIDNAISDAQDNILKNVADNYASTSEFKSLSETVSSNMTQTNKNIEMQFTTAQNYTKEVDGKLQEFQNTVGTHIRFGQDGIELGKTNSPFTAKLDNTKLAFLQDNEEIAYISNNKMHITNAEIKETLRIGTSEDGYFTWIQGEKGNLSLKWSDK